VFGANSCQGLTLRGNGSHSDMTEVHALLFSFSIRQRVMTHMNIKIANVISELGGPRG